MASFPIILSLLRSGFTTNNYYKSMNAALMRLDQDYTMLHYPYYIRDDDSFHEAQRNLTDYCLSHLPEMKGKIVSEIGCGNGIQAIYILEKHSPALMRAIDLNSSNIEIARSEAEKRALKNIEFEVGDAQDLKIIEDNSLDVLINIESAFHYPDKSAFLREIERVLKPGGHFLIADILTVPGNRNFIRRIWKRKMHFNHWTRFNYESELIKSNLVITGCADITNRVIMGFMRYRHWLKSMKKGRFIEDQFIKLFYAINAELNISLLRRHRQYYVFTGTKPVPILTLP